MNKPVYWNERGILNTAHLTSLVYGVFEVFAVLGSVEINWQLICSVQQLWCEALSFALKPVRSIALQKPAIGWETRWKLRESWWIELHGPSWHCAHDVFFLSFQCQCCCYDLLSISAQVEFIISSCQLDGPENRVCTPKMIIVIGQMKIQHWNLV